MARIFISYSRIDETFARQLATALASVGADIWIDVEDIPAGMNWSRAIHEGLRQCDVIIVIITPESAASQNVDEEWQYFRDQRKPIIPVLLRQAEVHFQLSRLQYVNFQTQAFPNAFKQLHGELRRSGIELDPLKGVSADSGVIPTQAPLPERKTPIEAPPALTPSAHRLSPILLVAIIAALLLVVVAFVFNAINGSQPPIPTMTTAPTFRAADVPTFDVEAAIAATQTAVVAQTIAALPTLTPTATTDFAATIQAGLDATATANAGGTITATLLTPPPPTPTPTHTPTLTPLQSALILAQTPVVRNRDWIPFAYVHPDDPVDAHMMLVPVGAFTMGSDDEESDERPAHPQEISAPYWIDRTEVTRAQYQMCIDDGDCTAGVDNQYSTQPDQPINRVTWFQAVEYCAYRGMRLPTEREWEYAARGPESWVYPWGEEFVAENVVYGGNSNETAPVGSREGGASWVGALDLSGNVWEWVSSAYQGYEYNPNDGREDLDRTDVSRVLRGGSWGGDDTDLRSANRGGVAPGSGSGDFGFRCALSL